MAWLPLGHTRDSYMAAHHTLPRPQQSGTSRATSGIRKKIFIPNFYEVFKLFFFQPSDYQNNECFTFPGKLLVSVNQKAHLPIQGEYKAKST